MRYVSLILGLALLPFLLAGCPGMPGAPGGAGGAAQQAPPGTIAPPGLESGGARTLLGTTITAPNNQILLVQYYLPSSGKELQWLSVRRLTFVDGGVLFEGLNYDGRLEGSEKDQNMFVSMSPPGSFLWKYEPKPTPPAPPKPAASAGKEKPESGPKRGK